MLTESSSRFNLALLKVKNATTPPHYKEQNFKRLRHLFEHNKRLRITQELNDLFPIERLFAFQVREQDPTRDGLPQVLQGFLFELRRRPVGTSC